MQRNVAPTALASIPVDPFMARDSQELLDLIERFDDATSETEREELREEYDDLVLERAEPDDDYDGPEWDDINFGPYDLDDAIDEYGDTDEFGYGDEI